MPGPAMTRLPRLPFLTMFTSLLGASVLAACSSASPRDSAAGSAHPMIEPQRVTEHRGSDDLLTAGLGLDGLRAMAPPRVGRVTPPS